MSKTLKHIHKYIKQNLRHVIVWRCATCNHYMPPHLTDLVLGRESVCWGCGNVFRLDEESMRDDMPKCINCRGEVLDVVNSSASFRA